MKPKRFSRKSDAESAVGECQRNGWRAGIIGSNPWQVTAVQTGNGFSVTYDLMDDGRMKEYTRKVIA